MELRAEATPAQRAAESLKIALAVIVILFVVCGDFY